MAPLPTAAPDTVLLDTTVPRTLHDWLERFTQPQWAGTHLEGWLFEDAATRQAAQRRLASARVTARLHGAYKPLVHHFLAAVDCALAAPGD